MTYSTSNGSTTTGTSTFRQSNGIAFIAGKTYITSQSGNTVSICNHVTLSSCVGLQWPHSKYIQSTYRHPFFGGQTYIVNKANSAQNVVICTDPARLTSCKSSTGGGLFKFPNSIGFLKISAYVVSQSTTGGKVVVCTNAADLTGCSDSVYTFPNVIADIDCYGTNAYVTNYRSGSGTTVYICTDPPNSLQLHTVHCWR